MTATSSTEVFEAERPRLARLAYRMLGTPDEADDVVQDAWLRWQMTTFADIDNPAAWLTTTTTRLAIDRLTSARRRREVYVGPWLPEPLTIDSVAGATWATPPAMSSVDPALAAVGNESLELGLLRVFETLSPVERAVFLLHDVFGYPFEQISSIVDKTPAATRQIGKRARDRVRSGRPRLDAEPADIGAWSAAFFGAVVGGDIDRLMSMLSDDVVHISDGGTERRAARRPVVGPERVARLLINLTNRSLSPDDELHWLRVNGQVGLYVVRDGGPFMLTVIGWRDGNVTELLAILNPAKLSRFHARWLGSGPLDE
jgi:RNA polymerase sigma-70 factor (ECF subfamily)